MSEEEKENEVQEEAEVQEVEETKNESEEESKDESEESEEEVEVEENTEVKALTEKVNAMGSEIAELKAILKKPVMKSKSEQIDKSENFVEEKTQNPLDLI